MGFFAYYLAIALMSYALRYPYLLGGALVIWLLRHRLPDPHLYLKHARHVRRLRGEIAGNADNATARRDLAKIWLEKRRPRRAIPLLEEARVRDPESAELALLLGKALVLAGRPADALPYLEEAADKSPRLGYGEPYLVAGRALLRLGHFAEAEEALKGYLAINSSSVEGRVLLAQVLRERKDGAGARRVMQEARATFAQVPRFRRRVELRWYLRAWLMSIGLA